MLKLANYGKHLKKLNDKGFSVIHLILIVLVVVLLAGIIIYFFKYQKKDIAQPTSVSSQTQQTQNSTPVASVDLYAGWKSYTAEVGNFTFKYPEDGQVTSTKIDPTVSQYQKQQIDIVPSASNNSSENNFNFSFFVTSPNTALENTSKGQDWSSADLETFQNGLTHAITKKQESFGESRGYCPNMTIVGKDNTIYYYGYPLKNKYYISGAGGYCMRQKDAPSLNYDQQINSDQWKKMKLILKSVSFN
jgi:hypothetical protein